MNYDGPEDRHEVKSVSTIPLKADADNGLKDRLEYEKYPTDPLKAEADEDRLSDFASA